MTGFQRLLRKTSQTKGDREWNWEQGTLSCIFNKGIDNYANFLQEAKNFKDCGSGVNLRALQLKTHYVRVRRSDQHPLCLCCRSDSFVMPAFGPETWQWGQGDVGMSWDKRDQSSSPTWFLCLQLNPGAWFNQYVCTGPTHRDVSQLSQACGIQRIQSLPRFPVGIWSPWLTVLAGYIQRNTGFQFFRWEDGSAPIRAAGVW